MALVLLLASGVALALTKVGGPRGDTLMGTNGSDKLLGKGGSDWIEGRGGKDEIRGGRGNDEPLAPVVGDLDGGGGADIISGGPGRDTLGDGPMDDSSVDRLMGNRGDDWLFSANRPVARDFLSCGAGMDHAESDRKDIVRDNCERVRRFTPKTPEPVPPGPVPID
jgi:Ca2+-binding RTX toxin-like protein